MHMLIKEIILGEKNLQINFSIQLFAIFQRDTLMELFWFILNIVLLSIFIPIIIGIIISIVVCVFAKKASDAHKRDRSKE